MLIHRCARLSLTSLHEMLLNVDCYIQDVCAQDGIYSTENNRVPLVPKRTRLSYCSPPVSASRHVSDTE